MSNINSTNVFNDLKPTWIDIPIDEKDYDDFLYDIIRFFVFNSPCEGQSWRGVRLQQYGWKNKPWYSPNYLKVPLDKVIFGDKQKLFICTTRAEFENKIKGKDFDNNFFNHRDEQRVAMVNVCNNEYMSLFYHIRNSLAHGRIAIYTTHNNDKVFIMEDGKEKSGKFEVTARFVIFKSSLLKVIELLKNPSTEIDYSDDIINAIKNNKKTKSSICDELELDELNWKKTIQRLKDLNRVCYKANKWELVDIED